ncbi:MAG: carbohydrate ABC transporter permease [Sulfolobaceae archaeon]|nr:carbohydrate ABC transporter permease [Candidatus Jingweiarchaeum tengchongense]MCW1306129.1 carbohydrate ABC transporter permease [Candidatus Jingweiarchaeum tengchongense]
MRNKNILLIALIVFIGLVWLVPLLWPISTSLRSVAAFYRNPNLLLPLDGITTFNYENTISRVPIEIWYLNSFIVSLSVTVVVTMIDFLAAYPLARMKFFGNKFVYFIIIAGLMIPFTVLLVPLYDFINKLGLVNTYWGIILPQFVSPFGVFLLRNYLLSIPKELEESARIDGANSFKIAFNVIFPNSIPGITTVAIFTFLGSWNNLLWPIVATQNPMLYTLTAGLTSITSVNVPNYVTIMATSSIIAGLPLYLIFFIIQKYIVSGLSLQSGLK